MQQSPIVVRRVGNRTLFFLEGRSVPAVRGGNDGACSCGGDTTPPEPDALMTAARVAYDAGWLTPTASGAYAVDAAHLADHDALLRLVAATTGDEAAPEALAYAVALFAAEAPEAPAASDGTATSGESDEPPATSGETAPPEPGPLEQAITAATAGRDEFEGFVPTQWGHLPAREYATRAALRQQAADILLEWATAEHQALLAAIGEGDEPMPADKWHAYLFVEGIRTTDHRAVAMDALVWRDLPLPLEWARAYEGGHYGKVVVGSIETVERVPGPMGIMLWYGEGSWDLAGDDGRECARQVELQGGTRFVSADIEVLKSHLESASGGEVDFMDMLFGDDDEEWYDVLDEGRGMGATVVSTPAFPQCVIAPQSVELALVEPMVKEPTLVPDLVASGSPIVQVREPAPSSYLSNPIFAREADSRMVEVKDRTGRVFRGCPWSIDDDGRIYGHLALWGFCHTGFTQECVLAPRSRTGYAYFLTGEYRSAEGDRIPVGQLTIGTSHAPGYQRHQAAARHYDETGLGYCDITVGEDEFGIWGAGVLRSQLKDGNSYRPITPDDLRVIRATSPSGDWRLIGGGMELVAALNVNVPGFPVPRVGLAASASVAIPDHAVTEVFYEHDEGERRMVSLIAAGRMPRSPIGGAFSELRRKVQDIDSRYSRYLPLLERLDAEHTVAELEARIGL